MARQRREPSQAGSRRVRRLVPLVYYTLNPFVLLIAIFIVAVHHRIVLAEEAYLQEAFGGEYAEYCRRVRRYF